MRKHVQAIVTRCKTTGEKFTDGDFGPSEEDATGARSLYGSAATTTADVIAVDTIAAAIAADANKPPHHRHNNKVIRPRNPAPWAAHSTPSPRHCGGTGQCTRQITQCRL